MGGCTIELPEAGKRVALAPARKRQPVAIVEKFPPKPVACRSVCDYVHPRGKSSPRPTANLLYRQLDSLFVLT